MLFEVCNKWQNIWNSVGLKEDFFFRLSSMLEIKGICHYFKTKNWTKGIKHGLYETGKV